jgi:membrane fusion protein, heavy metal efflux system
MSIELRSPWLRNGGLIALGLAAGIALSFGALKRPAALDQSAANLQSPARPASDTPESLNQKPGSSLIVLQSQAAREQIQVAGAVMSVVPLTGALAGKLALNENFTARLSAPVDGRALEARFQPGDLVTRGTVLARVDSPDLSDIQAAARRAQVELDLKRANLVRSQELYGAGAAALKEVQAAQAEVLEAETELGRTTARLRQLNAKGVSMDARGAQFTLTSPIDGVVIQRNITVGQQVHGGDNDPLYVIADPRELLLLLDLPESDVRHFEVGQLIRFSPDGSAAKEYSAKVTQISPAVDPLTRRVQVRAAVLKSDASLRPEMYVRAFAAGGETQQAIEVNVAALIVRGSRTSLFVERTAGQFERIPVKVLAQQQDRAWVSAGNLGKGDRIVSSGALMLDSEEGISNR